MFRAASILVVLATDGKIRRIDIHKVVNGRSGGFKKQCLFFEIVLKKVAVTVMPKSKS